MTTPDPNHLLEQAKKSPAAVAIHDKQAWMSIFALYHVVEDPVGSTPHVGGIYDATSGQRGNGALSRFFDTFIAPNKISFEVHRDVVCANHVVRDITIHLQMSPTIHAEVPMHAIYELGLEQGEWKIIRLAAHWELVPMVMQLLGKGFGCLGVLSGLTVRMLKLQGVGGMLGFAKGALNVGGHGKRVAEQFVSSFNARNGSALAGCFASDLPTISLPWGSMPVAPSQLLAHLGGELALRKVMASGDTVTASLSLTKDGVEKPGVVVFEFNRKVGKIARIRFYW